MSRYSCFTLRVNTAERELITAVAQRLERSESDTVRLLVREKARELGVAHKKEERLSFIGSEAQRTDTHV